MENEGQRGTGIDFGCTGKVALITGAGRGLGRVTAEALMCAGAKVIVSDISQDALDECAEALPNVKTIRCDVSNPDDVDRMFEFVVAMGEGLDFLVNNAGIGGPVAAVDELTNEDITSITNVNINGLFYCARRATPLLKTRGGGAIINVSSVAGRMGYAERSVYSASKWAVIGLTRSLSVELGKYNIRVNSVLPGVIEGERHERLYRAKAQRLGISYEEAEERFFDQVALRCNIPPRDIAAAIVYFCSPAASRVSGQALGICGDIQYMRQ